MNRRDIWILYTRELRAALRERNIVVNSILIPILLYPLLMWLLYTGITFVTGQNEAMTSRIWLSSLPPDHNTLRSDFEEDGEIELIPSANPEADVRAGVLDAYVEFVASDGGIRARILHDESRDQSVRARQRAAEAINAYRDKLLEREASKRDITREQFQAFWIEDRNISSDREMGRFILGLLLPMILIIMLAVGGFHPAIDATAGERENSTWETLMTAATARSNIIAAKYLYVATMSFVAGVLNVIAMTISMRSILSPLGGVAAGSAFQIPAASVPLLILGAALLALFMAAGMMILASFARTFKEGQSMISPFYVAIITPIIFMQGETDEMTLRTALIPVVNVAMMFREVITGVYNWPLIAVTTAVELATIVLCLKLCMIILRYEDFVIGSYGGSFAKFLKERMVKR